MTLKTLTLGALAATAALVAGAPAMAQDWRSGDAYRPYPSQDRRGDDGYRAYTAQYRPERPPEHQPGYGPDRAGPGVNGGELREREDRIQGWIEHAQADGRLPQWRARHAQGELNAIRRAQHNLEGRQGGVRPDQAAWLNGRLAHLADYIRESGGGDGAGYGYHRF